MAAAVQFQTVTKHFGPVRAVDGIDLSIEQGQVVALLGPNGAGKSTSISLMLGLRRPTSGKVRVLGGDPATAVGTGRVGAMLQTGGLPPGVSVRELVSFVAGMHARPMSVGRALAEAGCERFATTPVDRLSGGQRQRARFAMAIVGQPELLFLDEPTVGFDVETRRHFWDSVRAAAKERRTILFCTHYLEEADAEADRIIVVQSGRIVADGSASAIKAQVAGRSLTVTLDRGNDAAALSALPGVAAVERTGSRVTLRCTDSDATVRALVASELSWSDLEVGGGDLEHAFLTLTSDATKGPGATEMGR